MCTWEVLSTSGCHIPHGGEGSLVSSKSNFRNNINLVAYFNSTLLFRQIFRLGIAL